MPVSTGVPVLAHEGVLARGRRRRRTPRARRLTSVVLVWAALLAGSSLGAPPAAAHPAVPVPDRLAISGYDFDTDLRSDVVAGRRTSLDLSFVAGRALVDGTIVVRLPRRSWPTPLHTAGPLRTGDDDLAGSFVVRPVDPGFPPGPTQCRGTATQPVTVQVRRGGTDRVGTVDHLSCRAGQQISVRLVEVRAPARPGSYPVAVTVSDRAGARTAALVPVDVRRRPATRLDVDLPAVVPLSRPVVVRVRVLRPDGRVDRGYRGWVRVSDVHGRECVFGGVPPVARLGARDAGVKAWEVVFQTAQSHRLVAEDVSYGGRGGRSDRFDVVAGDSPPEAVCSVSYH